MIIFLKNKHTLKIDDFIFKCCVGKSGLTNNKVEGDKKTPRGKFKIGNLFFRDDRVNKPITKLKCIKIKNNMGWCDDVSNNENYNKLIKVNKNLHHEKLFRKDHKYDLLIPIQYNYPNSRVGKGSCIFIHLTNNYKPTAGCIALKKKDFLILLKLINKKSIIQIN